MFLCLENHCNAKRLICSSDMDTMNSCYLIAGMVGPIKGLLQYFMLYRLSLVNGFWDTFYTPIDSPYSASRLLQTCCAVLCCAGLCCAVLCCAVLCCADRIVDSCFASIACEVKARCSGGAALHLPQCDMNSITIADITLSTSTYLTSPRTIAF